MRSTLPPSLGAVFLVAVGIFGGAVGAVAQIVAGPGDGQCDFVEGTGTLRTETIPPQGRRIHVSTPRIRCDDGTRIDADSATTLEGSGLYQFFGRVYVEDPTRILRAQRVRYFERVGQLTAWEEVEVTDRRNGSWMRGEFLEYFQASEEREQSRLSMRSGERPEQRARALLYPSSEQGVPVFDLSAGASDTLPPAVQGDEAEAVPYLITADSILIVGEEEFSAGGRVEIVRDSLEAYADEVVRATRTESLELKGDARILDPSYTLVGDTIVLLMPGDEVREVISRRRARLTGEDLDLVGSRINLALAEGTLESMVAVVLPFDLTVEAPADSAEVPTEPPDTATEGVRIRDILRGERQEPDSTAAARPEVTGPVLEPWRPRPRLVSTRVRVEGDSVHVAAPGGRAERMVAAGGARVELLARDDSLRLRLPPSIAETFGSRDWAEGDTVVAIFEGADSAIVTDSTVVERDPEVVEEAVRDPVSVPAVQDSTEAPVRIRELRVVGAGGSARAFYRIAPDTTAETPAGDRRVEPADSAGAVSVAIPDSVALPPDPEMAGMHYVMSADSITMFFEMGEVTEVRLTGSPVEAFHFAPRSAGEGGIVARPERGAAGPARPARARTGGNGES